MKIDVHDIIKLNLVNESKFDLPLSNWATESLKFVPYVVVRRGKLKKIQGKTYIPIGIRGKYREERFGCFMLEENCEDLITPEQIVSDKMWINSCVRWNSLLEGLEQAFKELDGKLVWGPIGSVGFELATKQKVTNENSDLDIVIKPNQPITSEAARKILNKLLERSSAMNTVIDANMKTSKGWISLAEYASGIGTYLIKTETVEKLVKDIW